MKNRILEEITDIVKDLAPDRVLAITDSNVAVLQRSLVDSIHSRFDDCPVYVTQAGESHKSWESLHDILTWLSETGATRRSLLICIGGGMVTDLGGLAAALFKRGIRTLNVATTLLGAVDAAIGGKTAIDFNGHKNEVGAFHMPQATLFDVEAFQSLPDQEILSGFGEIAKTVLISSPHDTNRLLACNPLETDNTLIGQFCAVCRDEKERVVKQDPTEKNLRKVLNFGHTAGHALESLMLEKGQPMAHGIAVAHGILVALILSNLKLELFPALVSDYAHWLRSYFPQMPFTCSDYPRIWEFAVADKKNSGKADILNYTLISAPGSPEYDVEVNRGEFENALDIYQEFMGR